jgi:hypothetical protein
VMPYPKSYDRWHPKSYDRWQPSEDIELMRLRANRVSVEWLAAHFQRSANAVRSRLILLEDRVAPLATPSGFNNDYTTEDFGDLWAC